MDTLEAEYIGSLIASMVRKWGTCAGRRKQRPATYRDFCVLIRNDNAHGGVYAAKLLREMGIPAWSDTAARFSARRRYPWPCPICGCLTTRCRISLCFPF